MADTKISQLPAAATPLTGSEVLPLVQSGATKRVAADDLTVKNVRSNATTGILQIAGPGAGTTRVMTTPNSDFTVARTDTSQAFTGQQAIPIFASTFSDTVNKTNITLYEPTNGGHVLSTGFSTSFYSYANAGTTANVAYTANSGTALTINSLLVPIVGTTFTIGANTYTVTNGTPGRVYVTPSASGEAATGTLTNLKYATERVRIDSSGNQTLRAGNLVIGTSGRGIDFSATSDPAGMTSELLDDYEEGTWTPAYSFAGGGSSVSAVAVGTYTKVGRLVTAAFRLYTSSTTSVSGAVSITGLPYTSDNVTNGAFGGMLSEVRRFATDMPNLRAYVSVNTAVITILKQATNATSTAALDATDTNATANQNIISGVVVYYTA